MPNKETKEMNVLSLFDGLSGGRIALDRMGIVPTAYFSSEIDKDAIKCSQANWNDITRIGDITKVSYKDGILYTENGDYKTKIDLLIGGSPCFVAGTKVQTTKGLVNIEDVCVGDEVLTHTNTYQKVLRVGGNKGKNTVYVKAQGMLLTETTNEHPYYVRSKVDGILSAPTWKKAGDLVKGDYLAFPINNLSENPLGLTEDECLALGRYIADGHTRKDKRASEGRPNDRQWQMIISVGDAKAVEFEDKYKLPHSFYKHTQSVKRAVFSSKRLVEIAEEYCGIGSANKVFSQMLINLPVQLLNKVFEGYTDGGGCFTNNGWQATTVSRDLALSLAQVIAKVKGVGSTVVFSKRPEKHVILGREVNQKDTYLVRYATGGGVRHWKKEGDFIWYPFKSVKGTGKVEDVFNIEVENDNSYTANNFVVHNCQSFSSALALGGREITGLEGKSSLFYHYLRIKTEIEEYNNNLIWLLENVKMKNESKLQLDTYLKTEGVYINSKDFSFQKRARYYWTNLKIQPWQDKGVNFQDYKCIGDLSKNKVNRTPSRERMWEDGNGGNSNKSCANVTDSDKVYCLTTKQDRCPNSGLVEYEDFCRYLTQREMELAQTVPVGYTSSLSYNKACAVLGNGWTIDVICHVLRGLKDV